jgi:hypothetical protein
MRCQHCSCEIVLVEGQKLISIEPSNSKLKIRIYFCSQECKEKNVFVQARRMNIVGMVTRRN